MNRKILLCYSAKLMSLASQNKSAGGREKSMNIQEVNIFKTEIKIMHLCFSVLFNMADKYSKEV